VAAANGTSATAGITIAAVKAESYTISGKVTANGAPVSGVTLALAGRQTSNTTTAADGTYSFPGVSSGDYTVTPSRNNLTFSPPVALIKLTGNQSVNFGVSALQGTLSINRSTLRFGATAGGTAATAEQEIVVTVSDNLPVSWTVVSDQAWLRTTPSTGVGTGRFAVWLAPGSLPGPGIATAALTVSASGTTSAPLTVQVTLGVSAATGSPFGSFDTPVNGAVGLGSAFAVTGWALDDLGVTRVQIWRERVGLEPVGSNGMVYIGDAVFVPNARPDVEYLYPNHPANYRAGWGYMLLSNFLPNPSGGPAGNGTFRLHAVALDAEGRETDLGVKTITVDNAGWAKPLGAIDTPSQGEVVSGSAYMNSGWSLTPPPNKILNSAPSAIQVYVDGVSVGSPAYNLSRSDIAGLFPGYANSAGAGGSFILDTTKYANGMHSIAWLVTDNGGRADGIGSRYFSILNSAPAMASVAGAEEAAGRQQLPRMARQSSGLVEEPRAPSYRKGFAAGSPLAPIPAGGDGLLSPIELDELERVEIHLPAAPAETRWTGGIRVNGELRPLPAGSTLDREQGVFYWQIGPGFLGEYQLEFSRQSDLPTKGDTVIQVRVRARGGTQFPQ
jgi:hypothetical protein